MTKYRALTQSYHNNRVVEPGDVIDIDGIDIGSNYELADKNNGPKNPAKPVPPAVEVLINAVRMHAASRGVPPTDVNELDFDTVVDVLVPKPSVETIKAAADKLGVKLGTSVA